MSNHQMFILYSEARYIGQWPYFSGTSTHVSHCWQPEKLFLNVYLQKEQNNSHGLHNQFCNYT